MLFINFSGFSQSRLSEFCVIPSEVQIRPNASDFDTDGIGRVLISDDQGDYYTGLQSADRALTILVYLPDQFKGEMVYFTIHDPDDPSDYEPDTTPGDNNCTGDASLQYNNVRALQYSIFGTSFPLAINRLVITDRCSGDNYQVLCSLTPPDPVTGLFPSDAVVYSSIVYTAWKRIYVNYAEMYKRGSFVKEASIVGLEDIIFVQSHDDLVGGEKVKLVDKNGVTIESSGRIVEKISSSTGEKSIRLSEPFTNYSKYDRIYSSNLDLSQVNDKYSFDYLTNLIAETYGQECNVISGETYVDVDISSTNIIVPNYNSISNPVAFFTNPIDLNNSYIPFFQNYGLGFNYNNNVIDVVASANLDPLLYGVNIRGYGNINLIQIFDIINGSITDVEMSKRETFVHEVGHLFEVTDPHVDNPIDVFERCNNLRCIMARPANSSFRFDGLTKFDETPSGCIYDIRRAVNPK